MGWSEGAMVRGPGIEQALPPQAPVRRAGAVLPTPHFVEFGQLVLDGASIGVADPKGEGASA